MRVPASSDPADLTGLVEARHADPFGVLGPHLIPGGIVIRAMLPDAREVHVVGHGGEPVAMERRHDAGVFEAQLSGSSIPDYRLRVTYPDDVSHEIVDPYRYGRVIGDYDLYLLGEGNHTRIY
jgi:1,4-alpha-glucan branching enzyme